MAAENIDLGLNLVFENPASSSAGSPSKDRTQTKKKRKNKYDRRRERGRLAKEAKKLGKTTEDNSSKNNTYEKVASASSIASKKTSVPVANKMETKCAELTNNEDVLNSSNGTNKSIDIAEVSSSDNAVAKISSDGEKGAAKEAAKEKIQSKSETKPLSSPLPSASRQKSNPINEHATRKDTSTTSSRRNRPQASLDEEQRSKYLSEFHQRPRDLDRSEGASKNIKASVASDHIFSVEHEDDGADSDGDGDGEVTADASGGENVTKDKEAADQASSCPFQKIGVHSNLATALTSPDGKFRLKQPTIVQSRSLAALLPKVNSSKDSKKRRGKNSVQQNLFIQSETGSGKTLAYLLPILQQLAVDSTTNRLKKVDRQIGGTRCIILCPTRELATQTYTMCNNLCNKAYPWLVPGCFSGGEKRKSEKARLRKGISILIATPGRLLDHVNKTESLLVALKGKLEWLVLDEADRLLDAGLGGQVEQIMQHLRSNQPGAGPKRDGVTWRSVLVSATVTPEMEGLARAVLGGDGWEWARGHKNGKKFDQLLNEDNGTDDVIEANENNELDNAAPRQLAQLYMVVSAKLRLSSLIAFLAARASAGERTVVFLSTCDSVDYHHALFTSIESILGEESQRDKDTRNSSCNGIFGKSCPIYKLHGDIPHTKRISTLKAFSEDTKSAILLATDVAARGLNFPQLDWIVQYDPPCETKDYVHRAGRSARAGQAGHALLFLLPSERQYVEVLQLRGLNGISALSLSATLTAAANICRSITQEGESRARGNTFSDGRGEAFTTAIQTRLEESVLQDDVEYRASIEKKFKGDPKQRRKAKKEAVGPLLEGARKAFSAFVRAYPAKEKAVKHIFNARALHLGHIARSLALKDTPKMVSKISSAQADDGGKSQKMSGEKRKSRLAFSSSSNSKNDDEKVNSDDEENERYMSLLGDALDEQKERKSPMTKKKKTDNGGGTNARKRMMEAAKMMQQGLKYM